MALRAGPWVPIPKDLEAYCQQAASFMLAGFFNQAGGTEGWEADLASSTAEGVGGFCSIMTKRSPMVSGQVVMPDDRAAAASGTAATSGKIDMERTVTMIPVEG